MKLHSPQFEKALRRRVKQTVRASPELRREYKRTGKTATRIPPRLILLVFSGLLAVLVSAVAQKTSHPATALAVMSLWTAAGVVNQAGQLRSSLYASRDLPAFRLLPILEEDVFKWQFQKFLRGSLLSLLNVIAGFAALGVFLNFGVMQYLAAAPLAILCWAMLVALTILCAKHLMAIQGFIVIGLYLGTLVLFFGAHVIGPAVLRALDHAAPMLNLLLPTGWAISLFQLLLPHPQWVLLLLIFPIVGMLLTAKDALASMREVYLFRETVAAEAPDILPGQPPPSRRARTQSPLLDPLPTPPQRVGVTTIEDIITTREFLAPIAAPAGGWLETTLWRWFTTREKKLAEFISPQGINLTRPWKTVARNFLVTAVATLLADFIHSTFRDVVQEVLLAAGLFITVSHVVFLTLTTGRAFTGVNCSGVMIPMYAAYAIGFRELTNVLVKITLVQLPYCLAFTVAGGAIVAHVLGGSVMLGFQIGFRAGLLLVAVRFLAIAYAFSSGTNDGSRFALRNFALLVVMTMGTFAFLVSGILTLSVQRPSVSWPLCLLAVLLAAALLRTYQWFYNSWGFDLMSLPRK